MPQLYIPSGLRAFTNDKNTLEVPGTTVDEVLDEFVKRYPSTRNHLFVETHKLRSHVNIFVNDDDISFLDKTQTRVKDGDQISIVPSLSGGDIFRG